LMQPNDKFSNNYDRRAVRFYSTTDGHFVPVMVNFNGHMTSIYPPHM